MKKFMRDILSEEVPGSDKSGKFSAKRFMGILVGVGALLGSTANGMHWYDVSPDILSPMWIYSGAMLGVSVLKGIGKSN